MQQNNEAMTSLLLGGQAVTMGACSACVQNVWERPGLCIREPRKEKQPDSLALLDGQGLVWFVPPEVAVGDLLGQAWRSPVGPSLLTTPRRSTCRLHECSSLSGLIHAPQRCSLSESYHRMQIPWARRLGEDQRASALRLDCSVVGTRNALVPWFQLQGPIRQDKMTILVP